MNGGHGATMTRTAAPASTNVVAAPPQRPSSARRPTVSRPRVARPEQRQKFLWAGALVIVGAFVAQLINVQVIQGPSLAADALASRMSSVTLPGHRGNIVDAQGVVLATSVDRYTIVADQLAIQSFTGGGRVDAEGQGIADGALGIAQLLGPVLRDDVNELAATINGDSRYVVLAKDVEPNVQREIRALGLAAYIRTDLVAKRTYPAGTTAGQLLGFVDNDQVGQGGIEKAYDAQLAGTAGAETYERSLDGVRIPGGKETKTAALAGHDVVLTIDSSIQWKAQDSINDAVKKFGAAYGIVVVQDVHTGQLLAVADSGSTDPNDRTTDAVAHGSRAVQDTFEPGSTGKVITMSAALETGAWKPTDTFTVPYRYTVPNGQVFNDSHDEGTQHLTLAGILAKSSNSGTVQVAERIKPQVQYDYMHKFGLGQVSGLGLPGESEGVLHPVDAWDGRTRYAVTFGQGVTVNAMQATSVFSTIANGGVRVAPSLFKGTQSPDGEFTAAPAALKSRIVSEKTSKSVLRMMESVLGEEGTAQSAAVKGYRVAGKTGTAQIRAGRGWTYMASFIGVAPAENPRYTVAVFLKSPSASIYGGVVAAPVFSDVMGFVLQRHDVPPSTTPFKPYALTW